MDNAQHPMPRADNATGPLADPRVTVNQYLICPTGYEAMVQADKIMWCLVVTDGQQWGWSIQRAAIDGGPTMDRHGEWVYETRGDEANRARRWPLDEALVIALRHVDTNQVNGRTAAQASAQMAAQLLGRPR